MCDVCGQVVRPSEVSFLLTFFSIDRAGFAALAALCMKSCLCCPCCVVPTHPHSSIRTLPQTTAVGVWCLTARWVCALLFSKNVTQIFAFVQMTAHAKKHQQFKCKACEKVFKTVVGYKTHTGTGQYVLLWVQTHSFQKRTSANVFSTNAEFLPSQRGDFLVQVTEDIFCRTKWQEVCNLVLWSDVVICVLLQFSVWDMWRCKRVWRTTQISHGLSRRQQEAHLPLWAQVQVSLIHRGLCNNCGVPCRGILQWCNRYSPAQIRCLFSLQCIKLSSPPMRQTNKANLLLKQDF